MKMCRANVDRVSAVHYVYMHIFTAISVPWRIRIW